MCVSLTGIQTYANFLQVNRAGGFGIWVGEGLKGDDDLDFCR